MQPERSLLNYLTLLVMLMGSIISMKAQSEILFRSGDQGYECFRIPAGDIDDHPTLRNLIYQAITD